MNATPYFKIIMVFVSTQVFFFSFFCGSLANVMHVTFLKGHSVNSLRGKKAENVSAFFEIIKQ